MEVLIEAGQTERRYWRDVWRYRELFYFLAWRDVLVRYKQTVIGVSWALIRPLLAMIMFTFVFGKVAKLPSYGIPYPVMVMAAMLPWQFFATAMADASSSLVGNANLISKIYFPRLILPASAVITGLADFLISLLLLAGLMVWYRVPLSWQLLGMPMLTLLTFIAALGPGILLTALNVKYRDFRYVIPFIVQFGLFVSPVGYSSEVVPAQWRYLYALNPMVGVIDGFRWSISGGHTPVDVVAFIISTTVSLLLLYWGMKYFRMMERTFADVI